MRLTKQQKSALEWFADHEPASAFPCDGSGPSLRFVKRLVKIGLVEEVGVERGMWGFTKFARSGAGRRALQDGGKADG